MYGGTGNRLGFGMITAALTIGASTPVMAADLGGNCCADLEERIADLEASTARKGNRKVSLEVSGFVNETLFVWDDGVERNAYIVTNETNPTRIRFKGDAKISNGFSAGYLLELGTNASRQDRVNQNDATGTPAVIVRHSAWWLSSKEYGKLWVGQTSDAADGITEVNLANTGHFASANIPQSFGDGGGGFNLRKGDGTLSAVKFGNLVTNGWGGTPDGHRSNLVKYETPTYAGFIASAAWGEDDIWNAGIRYNGEYAGVKLAAGIAYSENKDGTTNGRRRGAASADGGEPDSDVNEWGGSASILHTQTGLFATAAYGQVFDNNLNGLVAANAPGIAGLTDDQTDYLFVQAGIERKFFAIGRTTFYGEYFQLDRGLALATSGQILGAGSLGAETIVESELEGFGFGVNQNLSDAIDLYIGYRHVSPDVTVANKNGTGLSKADVENFDYVVTGAFIKF